MTRKVFPGAPKRAFRSGIAALAGVLALQGCDASETLAPETDPVAATPARQGASYAKFARALAISLADRSAAEELQGRISSSILREDRVDLSALTGVRVHGENAETPLMARASGAGGDVALAAQVRRMLGASLVDVYFPVAAHREQWKAGDDVLVAYFTGEHGDALPAYNTRGERVMLDLKTPPATPVLVVTRSEGVDARAAQGPRKLMEVQECSPDAFYCEGSGGGGGGYYPPPPPPPTRYRSQQGYGLAEKIVEHKIYPDIEYWYEGGPEPGVSIVSHMPSPYNTSISALTNVIYLHGGDDDPIWYGDNRVLWNWHQSYGDLFTLHFWEADGGLNTGTITVSGRAFGYERPNDRDDLGQWTSNFHDQSLTTAVDGRGVGRWGGSTGRIAFTTDYVTP